MIKKDYMKPTMKVVELRQKHQILTVSGPQTLRGTSEDWEELE
jgi:hypothetical protein